MTTDAFPISDCPTCNEPTLVARELDASSEFVTICTGCDHVVAAELVRWVTSDQLAELGYQLEGRRDPHGERGCRDGGCGVQQPR